MPTYHKRKKAIEKKGEKKGKKEGMGCRGRSGEGKKEIKQEWGKTSITYEIKYIFIYSLSG